MLAIPDGDHPGGLPLPTRLVGILVAAAMLAGCASLIGPTGAPSARPEADPGRRVLDAGYRIAFVQKRVVVGSCWDFVNAVYDAAGYPGSMRSTVFEGAQEGPYADPDLIRPGDWVMHLNQEYGQVTHSSIFVRWVDRDNLIAGTLDYVGMNRYATGKYTQHRYTKVYAVFRPAKE